MAQLLLSGEELLTRFSGGEVRFYTDGDVSFKKGSDDVIMVGVHGLRAREEAREAGSFIRFLTALSSSCQRLDIYTDAPDTVVRLVREQELSALYAGMASPSTCTPLTSLAINSEFMDIEQRLLPALTRPHSSITSLAVWLAPQHKLDCMLHIFSALALNTLSLTHLEVNSFYTSSHSSKQAYICETQLGTMLSTNKSLMRLELYGLYLPGTLVRSLFDSLQNNAHLTHLSLWRCRGEGWPSASSVLDCLRINPFLQVLKLDDTPLEGQNSAAIKAQLERNKESAEHLEVLKTEINTKQVQPTAVRLFLCGFPYSGKTTLASSLHKWSKPWHSRVLSRGNTALQRTRGIEVRMLEKDKVKVSLWDLAGQAQYHAFHDNMFPNLSNEATPSLFLFVWNPIQLHESNGQEIQDHHGESIMKTLHMFEQEFRYWLQFISSKTLTSSKFKPKLLVAVTRADRLRSRVVHLESGIKNWLKKTFHHCQEEFKEYIQFDMMEGYFEMDARNPNQIKGLAHHIFQCAQNILDSAPPVYQACDNARRVINDWVHKKRNVDPVVTKDKFFSILEQHDLHLSSKEVQEAVALSLNDSGDLIYFQSSNLVVLDTQWFCHHIMGDLLYFHGSEFQTTEDGFFSLEVLKELLESKLNSTSRAKFSKFNSIAGRHAFTSSTKIQGETLVQLLIGLRLACQQDNSDDIFIPASLCSKNSRQIYPSQYLKAVGNIVTYMGRRLKCKDSIRTFFTPGIFPLQQVTFHKMYSPIVLEEDVIAFSRDGVNVFAEFCKPQGEHHFIDILIHSCLNPDDTIKWVYEKVVNKMESVCAQPRGIQGVELTYEVINPFWVKENNASMEDRRTESVPMEELRGTLKDHLDTKGFEPDLNNVLQYTWPTTKNSNSVIDLLGIVETLRVIESYQSKFITDVGDALGVNMEKQICYPEDEQEEKVFSSSIEGKERKWIFDEVREARKDIQRMHTDLQKIKDNICRLCNAVVPMLQETMDELLTFAMEGEAGKLPRLFVVTRNDGLVRKIIDTIVPGLQNVRLELLCEHRRQPHLVDDQPGLSFDTLEDGLVKRGLPYIINLLKVAQVAVKVGVHAAAGLGDTIPDFASVLASIEATPQTPHLPTYFESNASSKSRTNLQEGQQWLLEVLSLKNCLTSIQIHHMFGLSRVRCPDLHIRWLCDKHCYEGELCPI